MKYNNTLISIIIPCYNSERFLSDCFSISIKSVLCKLGSYLCQWRKYRQHKKLLDEYSEKEGRIKVYTQINQGVAKAREYGIDKSVGDYVTFLDADDTLTPNALQCVVDKFEYNPDIVVSGFNIVQDGQIRKRTRVPFVTLNSLTYLKSVLCGKYGWELCSKVYKRQLFNSAISTPKI